MHTANESSRFTIVLRILMSPEFVSIFLHGSAYGATFEQAVLSLHPTNRVN